MTTAAALNKIKELLLGPVTRGFCRNINPELAVTSATIPTSNRIYWMRLIEGATISTCRFGIIASSGNICIAYARNIGSGSAAAPGEMVATTGAVGCPASSTTNITGGSNGDHELALSATVRLKAGDWVGIAADNTTVALRSMTTAANVDSVLMTGSGYRETIASGSPAIPTSRATLTGCSSRNWLILGV